MQQSQATSYKLPEICCRCGKRLGVIPINLKSKQSQFRYYVVISVISEMTQTILVKVCDPCKRELQVTRLRNFIVVVGAFGLCCLIGAIVGVMLPWLTNGIISYNWFIGAIIGIIAGMFSGLALAFVLYDRAGISLGTYDGAQFWFANRIFHEQFSALNPSMSATTPDPLRASRLNWQ